MGKKIFAVVAGLIVNALAVAIIETIGHTIIPPPDGFDRILEMTREQQAELFSGLSVGSLLFNIVGWAVGPFLGALVAAKIMPEYWKNSSFVIGVVVALLVLLMTFQLPHPTWMVVVGLIVPVPMAYLGGKLLGKDE